MGGRVVTLHLAMTRAGSRLLMLACVAAAACSRAASPGPQAPAPAVADADARFMADMIAHHAQAVVLARWAHDSLHAAAPAIRTLAERIRVSQQDEIAQMERWLRERGLPLPDVTHAVAGHAGHGAGMLTAAQLAELAAARGPAFDRLFLRFMIQHHLGAVTMAERLLASPGPGRDAVVIRFAQDAHADQTAEIERMRRMLVFMP
jgi:uncharacterized protein (DUF305 family)